MFGLGSVGALFEHEIVCSNQVAFAYDDGRDGFRRGRDQFDTIPLDRAECHVGRFLVTGGNKQQGEAAQQTIAHR